MMIIDPKSFLPKWGFVESVPGEGQLGVELVPVDVGHVESDWFGCFLKCKFFYVD
jgi:hypothetical protein